MQAPASPQSAFDAQSAHFDADGFESCNALSPDVHPAVQTSALSVFQQAPSGP